MTKKIITVIFIVIILMSAMGTVGYIYRDFVKDIVITLTDNISYTYASLTGKDEIEITQQPVSVAVPNGVIATVGLEASGEELDYEWYFNDADSEDFIYSPEFEGNKYSVAMEDGINGREVYCVITNKYGNQIQTDTVAIRRSVPLTESKNKKSIATVDGEFCILSAETNLGGLLEYQWYFADKGSKVFKKSSITTRDYRIVMDDTRSDRKVYCVVKNNNGDQTKTQIANLRLIKKLQITKQPTDVTLMSGRIAKASVIVSGEKELSYVWYISNKGSNNFYKSTDFDSEYALTISNENDGRKAFCIISDNYGQKVRTNTITFNKDPNALHILIIGNSHSLDVFWHLRDVYLDQNPDKDIFLGLIYSSSGSIADHATTAKNNYATNRYYKNDSDHWRCTYDLTHREIFEDQEWDIILMQPGKKDIITPTVSKKERYELMAMVDKYVKNPHKFMWHVTWPSPNNERFFASDYVKKPPEGYKERLIELYGFNPINQYTEKITQTKKVVLSEKAYAKSICSGAAVMHALYNQGVSQLDLYRDYTHLSDYGRLLSSYSFCAQLTGKPVKSIGLNKISKELRFHLFAHLGDIILTKEKKDIIIKAANYSLESPWVIPDGK